MSLSLSPALHTVALLLGGFAPLTPRAEPLVTASRWRGGRVAEPLCGPVAGEQVAEVAG